MRKSGIVWMFFLCFTALVSCSKDEPTPDPELTISTETLSFSNAAETKFFHIKSNQDWKLISSESWLTFSAENGNKGTIKIDVSAAANALTEQRTATITAKVGSLSKTITVIQSASSLLVVEEDEFNVVVGGDEITVPVQSSGTYSIAINSEWITLASGGGTDEPKFTVISNPSMITREGTITFTLNGLTQTVTVSQVGNPLNIPADNTGMSDNIATLASKMKIGWNLGNSLEATNVSGEIVTANETLWGNAKTTQGLIDAVKAAGFNTVRIPCAWNGYIVNQTTHKIDDAWLTRVKEVVDYCLANGMYAIVNIHWDGGWLENNPTYAKQVAVNLKQKALWEQIAVAFRNYDEHLLFAGTNEVHAASDPTAENFEVQMSYNQTFVNAVRSTGGRNAYRALIAQAYVTNIDYAMDKMVMPTDIAANRLMAEVHFYDPWDFCGLEADASWATVKYFWGAAYAGNPRTSTWGQESWVDSQFARMKSKFVDNNIPVILGEYGATLRSSLTGSTLTDHIASRNNFFHYVTKAALENGLVPVYWDNGGTGNNGSGLFNRSTNAVVHADAVQAIISALD